MKAKLLTLVICILLLALITGCGLAKEGSFGIVLAATGETVLTERHIAAYHIDGTIDLNNSGISKWNIPFGIQDPTKKVDTLYNKEFIIKIDDKEVCRGKFWSKVPSASVNGIVILDSLFKMDDKNHSIQIQSYYPGRGPLPDSISSELERFFSNRHLLK